MAQSKAAKAMKKAWELFRRAGVRTMEAWRQALRRAWAIVKGLVKEEKTVVELKGTPKQVKWANDIRARIIPVVERIAEVAKKRVVESYSSRYGEEMTKERVAQFDALISDIINEQAASKWIERFGYAKDERAIVLRCYDVMKDICSEKGYSGRLADIFRNVTR